MTAITATAVKTISAIHAARIVRCAKKQFVWAARFNVPPAVNQCANIVQPHARNAVRLSAVTAWIKKQSVTHVNKKARNTKMMNKLIRRLPETVLRFSPYAWAKLVFMRDFTENEVGAFGISRPDDLLLVKTS
jgi:hypothetical protein